ncbi:MAG TPA: hypothetical protein VND93_10655 [Myxococcales bacterium]|jgi:hypothetical protein|nr:hypothetical protein [Myxococcales bacterium]
MKVAFCVEDESDERVACALLSKISGTTIELDTFQFSRGGWTNALNIAPAVAWHAYRAGLAGAIFMIDNDGVEPEHSDQHDSAPHDRCRLCMLRAAAETRKPGSQSRLELPPLWFLFAVPVQTLEAWLLLARGERVDRVRHLGKSGSERRALKRLLYGTDTPHRALMLKIALPIVDTLDMNALAQNSSSFSYFLKFARLHLNATPP